MTTQDIAIVHEKLLGHGGAQHVAYELARALDAPIYAGWVDTKYVPDDVTAIQVFSDRSRHILRLPIAFSDAFHMLAWVHRPELHDYDTVIINKTNCAWYVPKPQQTVLHYLHHPPRSSYDNWHRATPGWNKRALSHIERTVFEHTFNYPDTIIANSEVTAHRLTRYLNRQADDIVYPPVDTTRYTPDTTPTQDYYLTLGRLAPNKRVDEIITATQNQDQHLKVAGSGSQQHKLQSIADEHTTLLGQVPESAKPRLYAGARAFIFNAEQEDFGLTPIEAMAAGTPVIGIREGFTEHQINDGKNGILYDHGDLEQAIQRFETDGVDWTPRKIADSVTPYSRERFREQIREHVETTRARGEVHV